MIKRKQTLIQIRLRQASIMRKRRRAKRVRRLLKTQKRRRKQVKIEPKREYYQPKICQAVAPSNFSITNIEGLLSFISRTEIECRRENKVSFLKVNLDNVNIIDYYAISFLLSFLNKLSSQYIRYWGTYPVDYNARQFIINSGFLSLVKTNIKKPSNTKNANQIFTIGKDSVDSHLIGQVVRDSMMYITGKREIYPPVYDNLLEISANSVEHANKNKLDKNWLISISLENNKVHFIVTDTGEGILATLKKKATEKLLDTFTKGDAEVLHDVFMKLYQSITGEINRHKGLPIILDSFLEGYISDLVVVTNKVYYDFSTNKHRLLKRGFNGVMYSWTISINNYNIWLNSL